MMIPRLGLLCAIVFLFAMPAIAQTSTVIMGNDGTVLSYATVINLRTGKGVFASANGTIDFVPTFFASGDRIKVSFTGYADTTLQLPVAKDSIVLQLLPNTLENVEVFACPQPVKRVVSNYKKHTSSFSFGMGQGLSGTYGAYVPNAGNYKGFIETITIEQYTFSVPTNARKAPFKIRLLSYDTITHLPGNPLSAKEWLIFPASKKTALNIAAENIRLPANGIVVCVDYFFAGVEYTYQRMVTYTNPMGKKENRKTTFYGASFRAVQGENLMGTGFIKANKSDLFIDFKTFQKLPSAIMVSLNINVCN
jgi:hypothetical protein